MPFLENIASSKGRLSFPWYDKIARNLEFSNVPRFQEFQANLGIAKNLGILEFSSFQKFW